MAVIRVTTEWLLKQDPKRYAVDPTFLARKVEKAMAERRAAWHERLRQAIPPEGIWLSELALKLGVAEESVRRFRLSGFLEREWRFYPPTRRKALWLRINDLERKDIQ
jgi:hypothetical protein